MSTKRRSPLILASTTAAINAIIHANSSIIGSKTSENNKSEACVSSTGSVADIVESSGIVLTTGFLLWQRAKSMGVPDTINTLDVTALANLLKVRNGDKEMEVFDESTTVGVSTSVLRRLRLSSGSWVSIKDLSSNETKPARVMVLDPEEDNVLPLKDPVESLSTSSQDKLSIKSFPMYNLISGDNQQLDPDTAFLSPVLAFNLGVHVSWLEFLTTSFPNLEGSSQKSLADTSRRVPALQRVPANFSSWSYLVEITPFLPVLDRPLSNKNIHDGQDRHNPGRVHFSHIKYATHMRIGLVRVPTENGFLVPRKRRQAEIDASLQEYFKVDRFLARGDVFSLQIVGKDSFLGVNNSDLDPMLEFIFFKVLAVEPSIEPLLCANHNHTALVLGGPVASQLPPLTRSTRLPKLFLRTPAVQQLASLLAPCLHPKVLPLHLRLSVLIHGPSGSGKQTVVRLAAEDLGMHVVEYNCYDFVGAAEGKTTASLMNSFKTAKRYSPSVLLLRHFEALGKSSSPGISGGDLQGAVSRVTSVLKTCITSHLPSISQENLDNASGWFFDELTDGDKKESSSIMKFAGMGSVSKGLVVVVAACEGADSLTPALRRCFTHEVVVTMPDEHERLMLLHHYLGVGGHENKNRPIVLDDSVEASLKAIAAQTSGLAPRDLRAIAADTAAVAITRSVQDGRVVPNELSNSMEKYVRESTSEILPAIADELTTNTGEIFSERQSLVQMTTKDLDTVLERVKQRTASAIGTPKVPNVKWEDVGGLEDVKKAILDTVQLPLVHRELFASGLRQRSGVLLYGPPGTGKTLLAKAVATECSLNFLSVKGPELINMYIGESEKNVREIFHKARAARPCVVFFDELDALAPARGASGDSGGVMDRVVSQMLAEIDGVSANSQDLFIIGASNRPDLIDPALLRPGRFDKLLYVGVSSENSYRERVLEALTRKFRLDKNVSLKALSQRCPVTYTGADMYALCADAWHQAVKREVLALERRKGNTSSTENEMVVVKQEDFIKAMGELTPSLSRAELDRYERLRGQFEGQPTLSSSAGRT